MADAVGLRAVLADPERFGRAIGAPLRSYQAEAAAGIRRAVAARDGRTIGVMYSRQAGKNQVSAVVEAWLLARHRGTTCSMVKTAPTLRPQLFNSIRRLRGMLGSPLTRGWRDDGAAIRLGRARIEFLSGSAGASVVGATASLLLELDEAQDLDAELVTRVFRPMVSSTSAPSVYYGTAWTEDTVLAAALREAGEAGGPGDERRFVVPWWRVAEEVPAYGRFVEGERDRLGETHPLFQTQYALETLAGGGRLFQPTALGLLVGQHERRRSPEDGAEYVVGVDLAGESEAGSDDEVRRLEPRRDSTAICVCRRRPDRIGGVSAWQLEVVDWHRWTGRDHRTQLGALASLIDETWGARRVCVDATGVGAGVASMLAAAMGERVEPVVFTRASKSLLGHGMLAMVNGGAVRHYRAGPEDVEAAEFWRQARAARLEPRGELMVDWFVPEAEGHDDFIAALALAVRAGGGYDVVPEGTVLRAAVPYGEERW